MKEGSLISALVACAVVVLVAGLTHLLAILILPEVATKDAYTLLAARDASANRMRLLPPSRPGDTLIPFRDPATVQAVCLYDVTAAPVRVRATTEPGRLLTLSFRTPDGRVFYSMTDRAALHDKIDIRLVTAAQLEAVEAGDNEDEGLPEELRLKAPTAKGLLVVTALVARPGDAAAAADRVKSVTCAPEPLPPPS